MALFGPTIGHLECQTGTEVFLAKALSPGGNRLILGRCTGLGGPPGQRWGRRFRFRKGTAAIEVCPGRMRRWYTWASAGLVRCKEPGRTLGDGRSNLASDTRRPGRESVPWVLLRPPKEHCLPTVLPNVGKAAHPGLV